MVRIKITPFIVTLFLWHTLMLATLSSATAQEATVLDQSFGSAGAVVEDFGFGDDAILDTIVQPDGKILVAGYAYNGAVKNIVVARYQENGELDLEFNDDGVFTTSIGASDSIAHSITLQNDGKAVVAASTGDEDLVAVLRLTEEGFADKTFGDDGTITFSIENNPIETVTLKIDNNDNVVVAGTAVSDVSQSFIYGARISPDGVLDEAFAEEGILTLYNEDPLSLTTFELLDDGKILGAGSLATSEESKVHLIRLTSDGKMDEEFGEGGEKSLGLTGVAVDINSSLIDSQGHIYLAGDMGSGVTTTAIVLKIDDAGDFLTEFGQQGVYLNSQGSDNGVNDMVFLDNGDILLAGFITGADGDKNIFIQTIDKNGALRPLDDSNGLSAQEEMTESTGNDQTNSGTPTAENNQEQQSAASSTYLSTDIGTSDDIGYAAVALSDGSVLVTGSSVNENDSDFAMVLYTSQSLSAGSSDLTESGVVTEGYRVMTISVSEITRVGALIKSVISDTVTLSCDTSCTAQCTENDVLDQDCYDSCFEECEERPTVARRGVVFDTHPEPVIESDDDGDDGDDDGDGDGDDEVADDDDENNDGSIFPQGDIGSDVFIRSGQTTDGEGLGNYSSELQDIFPGTTFYVRAYTVLSDDTVIYGNVLTFKTKDACFIATAAFGSIMEPHVRILREFRDRFLMNSDLGQLLVSGYYRYSPQLADLVRENSTLRTAVRFMLVPVVAIAAVLLFAVQFSMVTSSCLIVAAAVIYVKNRSIQVG